MRNMKQFLKDDTGAVTVDWVVLTAAVVGMALVLWPLINNAVAALAEQIAGVIVAAGENFD